MRFKPTVAMVLVGATLATVPWTAALAQELSEKSVRTFMDYAWSLTPSKFTKPDGSSVLIDRKERDKMTVPVDASRAIIMAGRLTAHAQICELAEEQVLNYRSLMTREEASKKWSPQQMIYINQLHLTTVMLLTGQIKVIERDGDKKVVIDEGKVQAKTCTDEQRKKVKELVRTYVQAGPKLSQAAPQPAVPTASTAAPLKKN